MFPIIQKGTKLRSRITEATATVIDIDYHMFGMSYTIDIAGVKRDYSYEMLMHEYSVLYDEPRTEKSDCNCGGLTTYKSKDSIYHSWFCPYWK